MSFNEEFVDGEGNHYGRDAFGWIWALVETADNHHEWIRTPYERFEEIS